MKNQTSEESAVREKGLLKDIMEPMRLKIKKNLEFLLKLLYRPPKPHKEDIYKFWELFEIFLFLLILRPEGATPLALRFHVKHPQDENFSFLESSTQVEHSHQISGHLELIWSSKRVKNTLIFAFLPSFQDVIGL